MGLTADSGFAELGGWPGTLGRLIGGGELSREEARSVFCEILGGEATPAQIASFVTALRMKGESIDEMAGFVRAMLDHAEPLTVSGDLVDTCGTGGDRSSSINVSTIAAFVVAGAGARVCKHGGRAATSVAGSADVLEALGVVIDLGPDGVARCIKEARMGFCFAPRFHPAMRFAAPVRRELGVPTVFNYLGPLANPGRACFQVVGVSDPAMADKMLGVLALNGCRRAMVVHGADNLDELSTTGPTTIFELLDTGGDAGAHDAGSQNAGSQNAGSQNAATRLRKTTIDAADLGLPRATLDDLRGSDPAANAMVVGRVLSGEKGPHRDIVVLNAAAALVVAGLAEDFPAGVERAAAAIDDGRAAAVLETLIRVSQECAESP
ncbi:MAG TPA: anthranilate phosphoribosyltransferase [Acidimicrobiales bacterium]